MANKPDIEGAFLPLQSQPPLGANRIWKVPWSAFLSDNALSAKKVIHLVANGYIAQNFRIFLKTPFTGGATTEANLKIGYDLDTGTDDDLAFLASTALHADQDEVTTSNGTGTEVAFTEPANIELTLTAVGANLNELTAGEVWIFARVVNLAAFVDS